MEFEDKLITDFEENKPKPRVDYITFWNSKGAYGETRVKRMLARKKQRLEKAIQKRQYKRVSASWDEDGQYWQNCEMGGKCHSPCNGDC